MAHNRCSFPDFLLLTACKVAQVCPLNVLYGCCNIVAWLAVTCNVSQVRQLRSNLERIYASANLDLSAKQTKQRMYKAVRNYFHYFVEAITVKPHDIERLQARVRAEGEGLSELTSIINAGLSVPLALGHLGNWDYAGLWSSTNLAPVLTVAEKLDNERLRTMFIAIRRELGITALNTGKRGLVGQLEQSMREKTVIVPLLADRDLSRRGVFCTAFGSLIRVARGPAMLALQTERPLFVVTMYRETLTGEQARKAGTKHGYVCTIHKPIDVTPYLDVPREEAIAKLSQAWVDDWSKGVAASPEDWHMMQPFFLDDLDHDRLHGDIPSASRV